MISVSFWLASSAVFTVPLSTVSSFSTLTPAFLAFSTAWSTSVVGTSTGIEPVVWPACAWLSIASLLGFAWASGRFVAGFPVAVEVSTPLTVVASSAKTFCPATEIVATTPRTAPHSDLQILLLR